MDYKKGVQDALQNFYSKELKKDSPSKKRKNKAPEKQVVKAILTWGNDNGFDLDVIEASTFDRYKVSMAHDTKVVAGYSDISGNDRFGLACYIEVKAPGRRSTLRESQRFFLERKISSGAFACVTDNISHLHNLYHQWLVLKLKVRELAVLKPVTMDQAAVGNPITLLMNDLPTKKVKRPTKEVCELDFLD